MVGRIGNGEFMMRCEGLGTCANVWIGIIRRMKSVRRCIISMRGRRRG